MNNLHVKNVVNFLFEAGILQKTPRSGFHFLGSGSQSVAEHLNRAGYIGFVLAHLNGKADVAKVLQMCMFHDFAEARVSDLNYVHQKYTARYEERAINDLAATLPFGAQMRAIVEEYEARETIEAKITKDADNIEFLLSLKEQKDIGNERAATWIAPLLKRMLTEEGKIVAEAIVSTDSDAWWYSNKEDKWWVSRNAQVTA